MMIESYIYIIEPLDELPLNAFHIFTLKRKIVPILWAQRGRYGWISKEQVQNMMNRITDLNKQQKGYARDKPLNLVFHWQDTDGLDPTTVELMRKSSQ